MRPDIRSSPLSKITVFWDAVHDCAAPEPQMTALSATRLPACESTEVRILESRGFGVCHCHGLSGGTRVVFALVLEQPFRPSPSAITWIKTFRRPATGGKTLGLHSQEILKRYQFDPICSFWYARSSEWQPAMEGVWPVAGKAWVKLQSLLHVAYSSCASYSYFDSFCNRPVVGGPGKNLSKWI